MKKGILRKITNTHKQSTISFSLYSNCNELPMLRFMQCLLHNNYSALVKDGNPPHNVLQQTWEHVYEQYINLCSSDENAFMYVLQLKVEKKELLVELLKSVIDLLQTGYNIPGIETKVSQRLNQVMKLLRIGERFTLQADKLATELQMIRIILNEQTLELNELQKELEGYRGKENESITEEHFYNWATNMSGWFKFNIQLSQITVSEFEAFRKQYKKAITNAEMEERKRKRA